MNERTLENVTETTVKTLLEQAATAKSALDAVQFAQAARNAAETYRVLVESPPPWPDELEPDRIGPEPYEAE
jgi:thiazole synthase ThiGH ThiG subunit